MGIGSGIGGSFGFAVETTYGTYVAPTKWVESSKPELRKVKNTVQGGAMAAGRYVQAGSMRTVTTKAGGGTIAMEVYNKRMGHLLNGLMGGTVTPTQQGGTAAYLQTHPLADPTGKFYTMQTGVPDLGGTARPYTFLGSKITAIEFSCGIDQNLTAAITVDSRDVTEAETLAAPSYATGVNVFHFAQSTVKLGTYASEAAITGVRKMSVKIERPSRTDRFYMGNAGLKSEPIINDYAKITGTLEADYITKADLADRFAADSSTALVWEFVGPLIAGSFFETFRIKVPMIFFDGDTPILDGPDVVTGPYPFTGQYDLTNAAATIEYISTDTAL
jgi:tail tube protein